MITVDDLIVFLNDVKKAIEVSEVVKNLEAQVVALCNRIDDVETKVESLEQEVPEHEHEFAAEDHEHEVDDINGFEDKISAEVESQISDAIDATIDSLYIGRK